MIRPSFGRTLATCPTDNAPTQLPKSISTTSLGLRNFFFKSPARDDLLINFLVSVFTPCKNFTSVPFNLGRICWKQISSHFTITSHKSLAPLRLFCPRVLPPVDIAPLSFISLSLSLSSFRSRKQQPPYSEEKGSWNKIFTSARALFTKTRGASLPIISRADVPSASLLLSSFFFFGL